MATNVSERMLALADVLDVLCAQSARIAADTSLDPRHEPVDLTYVAGKQAALAEAVTNITGMLHTLWAPNTGYKSEDGGE